MDYTTRQGYRQHQHLLQRELGAWAAELELSLTPVHQRIVHTLDWLDVQTLLGYNARRAGAPECSRLALAQAFVAKAVLGLGQTKRLHERLQVDGVLRRLLGFETRHNLPSEATFSRAFAQFAKTQLPARMHEALIRAHLGNTLIGHIARDSTALHARERAVPTVYPPKVNPVVPKRRGPRPAGSEPVAPRSRIPAQLLQTPQHALAALPTACNKGKKRNAQGHINSWVGYKLHLDVAYDSEALRQYERDLGHVAINARARELPPTLDAAQLKRFGVRTVVERINGRLKDGFGCDALWVKGHAKVACHAMFAVLALSVDALLRLMVFEPAPQS